MANNAAGRPDETEYVPEYSKYVSLVPEGNIVGVLIGQIDDTTALLLSIPEERGGFRYAPGKWSIKELVGHLIDSERIFSYRALRFARDDKTELPGYEQDDYVRGGSFDEVPLADLAAEFAIVRQATVLLFKHLSRDAWTRRGTANECEVSVRALAHIIAGHELHHRSVLIDKYLT
ncbi:MAG TPA: DinB family protein [Pyrinomonadaceae bacterium]|nr:DinB family protein [Pyrinomonadaceae bacterium]